jgi:hypothetical protein
MTQTLSREPDDPLFQPMRDRDPATPGDPLRRLRFHYGQCLSAEDFEAEQRYFVLRQRLHNALLHGVGTVWGLAVRRQEPAGKAGERLICDPGLAIDPLGREIWVPQQLCLDLAALEARFWNDLGFPRVDPSDPGDGTIRRAYVVLRYEVCLTDAVPVIPLPCGDDQDGLAPSRLRDSFRLCLEAEAPPDPYATLRDISRQPLPVEPRQRLLVHALNLPVDGGAIATAPLQQFWSGADDAALLLATLDLQANGSATTDGLQPVQLHSVSVPASNPNNAVRAVLPAVQALADVALGIRLEGPTADDEPSLELETSGYERPVPFQLLGATATAVDGNGQPVTNVAQAKTMQLEIRLSEPVLLVSRGPTESPQVVQMHVWDENRKSWGEVVVSWPPLSNASIPHDLEPSVIQLKVQEVWGKPTTFQLLLKGTGPAALMADSTPPRPLAGVAGEVVPPGSGRDACLFATYTPPNPEPEAP